MNKYNVGNIVITDDVKCRVIYVDFCTLTNEPEYLCEPVRPEEYAWTDGGEYVLESEITIGMVGNKC